MSNKNLDPMEIIENLKHLGEDDKNGIFHLDDSEEETVIEYSIDEENKVLWINYSLAFIPNDFDFIHLEERIAPYIFDDELIIPDNYEIKYREWDSL